MDGEDFFSFLNLVDRVAVIIGDRDIMTFSDKFEESFLISMIFDGLFFENNTWRWEILHLRIELNVR